MSFSWTRRVKITHCCKADGSASALPGCTHPRTSSRLLCFHAESVFIVAMAFYVHAGWARIFWAERL